MLGIGYLSLLLFGRSNDWNEAYGPLHKKILKTPGISAGNPEKSRGNHGELDNLLGGDQGEGNDEKRNAA